MAFNFRQIVLLLSVIGAMAAQILGGKSPLDPEDGMVQTAAKAAAVHFDKVGNHMNLHRLKAVQKGTKQVVSGIKYEMLLELEETDCEKTVADASTCHATGRVKLVDVSVWSQPWKGQNPQSVEIRSVSDLA